jgi:predicted deacylase
MQAFEIAGHSIAPGESKKLEIPLANLYTSTEMSIPVFVRHGKKPGPVLFVSAAIHGDELNGVEIISRLINHKSLKSIKGTLIAIPFVNAYGVLNQSRYLPDRRDLNRSFPGSKRGSLAARVAHKFLSEIVSLCDYGIDLHTGAIHRSNLPQIRANIDDAETFELAKAFPVPVILNSNLLDGSLREAASEKGIKVLLYEAGEALRFDELSIKLGVRGVLSVMRYLSMLTVPKSRSAKPAIAPYVAQYSSWVRAGISGFVMHHKSLGDKVEEGETLATIKDPFGKVLGIISATDTGIIIGKQNIPLVQEGEAVYHIGYFNRPEKVVKSIDDLEEQYQDIQRLL